MKEAIDTVEWFCQRENTSKSSTGMTGLQIQLSIEE